MERLGHAGKSTYSQYNLHMNGRTTIDVGVAGSVTMIILCSAVALLLWNFYRRYKRLNDRIEGADKTNDEDN